MAAPRNGRNVVSRKMSIRVNHYEPIELFYLWTKVHQFFFPTWKGQWLMKFFFRCSICRSFRRYSRSKSKVVRNRAEIWTFLSLPNFWGRAFQKFYARYHTYLVSRRLQKFRDDTPTSLKVIEAHTLNFKPNFKFSGLIFWGGSPSQLC